MIIDRNRSALRGSAALRTEIFLLKPIVTTPYVSAGLVRRESTFCTRNVVLNVVWVSEQQFGIFRYTVSEEGWGGGLSERHYVITDP